MRVLALTLACGLVACGMVAACGGDDSTTIDLPKPDSSFVDAPSGDGGVDAQDDTSDAFVPDTNCPSKCSPTTDSVLDCNDQVLTKCAPTEACDLVQAKCVNACVAQTNNRQSLGCEFYPVNLEVFGNLGTCHAVVVANAWKAPATLKVEQGGNVLPIVNFARIPSGTGPSIKYNPYDPKVGLAAGEVALLFLGGDKCPVPSATSGVTAMVVGTTIGKSFKVTSDVPVAAYQINPYGGGAAAVTGASLLLPATAWGTNYIVNTASPQTVSPPAFDVVASVDNTQIKILPTVNVTGGADGGIPASDAGTQLIINLNAGEVAQLSQKLDLLGSVIESNKPVGVFSSSACMNAPVNAVYCDHGEQMLLPIGSLGSEYTAVSYRSRTGEPWLWRVIGVVDGTQLTYSPTESTAPTKLDKGQSIDFESTDEFLVSSQDSMHPFELFAYMSGGEWSKMVKKGGYGDPDHVVMTSPSQFQRNYVFFTDPTFPETNVVVVRAKNGNAFEDVTLDCAGVLTGWKPVGNYEFTRIDLQTGDFKNVGNCSNGRHAIDSKGPFGISVWGWGTPLTGTFTAYVSYGYPGGTNVLSVNKVVVPAK